MKSLASKLEDIRKNTPNDVKRQVELSFQIADRIDAVLKRKGLQQKDLAERLGKTESEISKWMRGTHNFTIQTISKIESALEEQLIVGVTGDIVIPAISDRLISNTIRQSYHETFYIKNTGSFMPSFVMSSDILNQLISPRMYGENIVSETEISYEIPNKADKKANVVNESNYTLAA
jgi:transcriptional regulator with XRE-family HTH domain